MLDLNIQSQLEQIPDYFRATQKELLLASKRALNRTTKWVKTHASREVAKASNIPLRTLKARVYGSYKAKKMRGTVWVGLNKISPKYIGAKQNERGVTAGQWTFPKSFIVDSKGGHVFRRTTKARFPISKQMINFTAEAQSRLEAKIEPMIQKRFFLELERQLQWAISKR